MAVHSASIQDRDGVALVLDRRTRRLFPFIERIYADGGYQGPKAAKAAARTGKWKIEIVERSAEAIGFEVLPKRWIVERTFAWISRFRRMARDFERYATALFGNQSKDTRQPSLAMSEQRGRSQEAKRT